MVKIAHTGIDYWDFNAFNCVFAASLIVILHHTNIIVGKQYFYQYIFESKLFIVLINVLLVFFT